MEIDKFGRVSISEQEALDSLYSGKIQSLEGFFFDQPTIEQFNRALQVNKDNFNKLTSPDEHNESIELFDEANQCSWYMPENYCPNLVEILYGMCNTQEQTERVDKELQLFIKHNMFDLLFYLKYLVDTMRSNNILWGVGRGSCVASYVLYLLGIHKIDSIKYQLDIEEFLK